MEKTMAQEQEKDVPGTESKVEDLENQSLTKKFKNDLDKGEKIFSKASDADTLTLDEQRSVRMYLYFLILQITLSLVLELITWIIAEYWWVRVAVAFAYIANSVKLYACVHCLVSLSKFHGCLAFALLIWVGPWLTIFFVIWDIIWYQRKKRESIVNHQYIKHFNNSEVSLAALEAISGVLDGLGGILNREHNFWTGTILAVYGGICFIMGIITLWKLRKHPDFKFKTIVCAPCTLWKITDHQYKAISDPKDDDTQPIINSNNNSNYNDNNTNGQ